MISLVAAYDENRTIGCRGKIPWRIPSERDRFKKITAGKRIIMGRKSFSEIGHALPYCTLVVVSKSLDSVPDGCILARSIGEAAALCGNDVIVAGGEEIYRQTISSADVLHITEILARFSGDTFFPEFDRNSFVRTEGPVIQAEIPYRYVTFTRIK